MFEDLNALYLMMAIFGSVGIMLIEIKHTAEIEDAKPYKPYLLSIVGLLIMWGMLLSDTYETKQIILKNTETFNKGKQLECIESSGRFLISKEEKWVLRNKDFYKNNRLISIARCR
jgi:hypothetical protein